MNSNLENIKVALKTWIASDDFLLWKIEFIWQMREFKNNLFHHFDFEEETGFFEHFPNGDSIKKSYGRKIKSEHKHILRELDKILTRLKRIQDVQNPRLKTLESDILCLINNIYQHEDSEINVLNSLNKPEKTKNTKKKTKVN
ncbi:MAG: hypothetical protein E4H13_04840 [Calditrichales bacterium]|nr:MAG: hypothetical protein E4H13_04840 [Calditrichales bacterium]